MENISQDTKPLSLKQLHKQRIQLYIELINQLSLSPSSKKQIHVDFINFIHVLHKLAYKHMLLNDFTNVIIIILSAVVPIIITMGSEASNGMTIEIDFVTLATILSVILAVLNAFRQAYKYRERWQNHLETAELLILEGQSFFALSGNYSSFTSH